MPTIFYSWQSDTPANINRYFIRDALRDAVAETRRELATVEAERGELRVDHDTKGLPGQPDIRAQIFRKIDECVAYVADLTFVGKGTLNPSRLMPNSNVLIEYGYAVRACGWERLILVMNTALGAPTEENMPFNLRGLRYPIQYSLSLDATAADTKAAHGELTASLVNALRIMAERDLLQPKLFEERVDFVYPPTSTSKATRLRITNIGALPAVVTVTGFETDTGETIGEFKLDAPIPPNASRNFTSAMLVARMNKQDFAPTVKLAFKFVSTERISVQYLLQDIATGNLQQW